MEHNLNSFKKNIKKKRLLPLFLKLHFIAGGETTFEI